MTRDKGNIYLKVLFAILLFFLFNNVKAASCSYKQQASLSKEATNINIIYTVEEDYPDENSDPDLGGDDSNFYKGTYLKIHVLNIPDNFYVNVINDFNDEEITLNNNNYEFDNLALKAVINYKFSIYSTDCPDVVLRLKNLRTPMYNEYSETTYCIGHEDLKECNQFYNGNLTYEKFLKAINKVTTEEKVEKSKQNMFLKAISWIYSHWYIFAIIIGLGAIATTIILIIRKRRIV